MRHSSDNDDDRQPIVPFLGQNCPKNMCANTYNDTAAATDRRVDIIETGQRQGKLLGETEACEHIE